VLVLDAAYMLKVEGGAIALYEKPVLELQSVTCRMGSHSVICYPTQSNAPRFKADARFTYPRGMEG